VWLGHGFTATDEVDLNDANITGQLGFTGSKLSSLNLSGVTVSSLLRMESLLERPKGMVDLRWAHVGHLTDDSGSWPVQNALQLDGFTYDGFVESPIRGRLAWLRLQPKSSFRPQPYEELASTLRKMGYQREAQQISVAEQREWRESGELSSRSLIWSYVLDYTFASSCHRDTPSAPKVFLLSVVTARSPIASVFSARNTAYKPGVAGSKPAPPTNDSRRLRDSQISLDRLVPVAPRLNTISRGYLRRPFREGLLRAYSGRAVKLIAPTG
jgi:hypothetical protein